ncbi:MULTISPECIES: hypothetical protein [unclassified Streptomyces]|uniref:hypothetical protein n=1 Tax=unclassified Streptomyces TaxID=2593676 RepID=UPI0004C3DDEF
MDTDETFLLRDALDRTAEDLPPLPDLVPLAVREGRRRRARARFAVGTAAFAVVTAGALGLALLPGGGTGEPLPAAPTVRETRLTGADWVRRDEYRGQMARLLGSELPVELVRPVGDRVSEYVIEAGGGSFRAVVSVRRPVNDGVRRDRREMEVGELRLGPVSESPDRVLVRYAYKDADVVLAVYAGKDGKVPVKAADLLAVAGDWSFPSLVERAYFYQMEADDPPLDPVAPPAGNQRAR